MAEKTMVNISKIIRLRNLMLTAIDAEEKNKHKFLEGTSSHSYRLGMIHGLKDFNERLNDLIVQG